MSRVVAGRLVLSFAAFLLLGLPEGVTGTAWPSMRADLGRPASNLAILLACYTAGYLLANIGVGIAASRIAGEAILRTGLALSAVGLAGYAIVGSWSAVLVAAALVGVGGGCIDSSLNAMAAINYGPRAMQLLHGFFGMGAMLGPLLVTVVIGAGASWRVVFAALAVAEGALLISVRRHDRRAPERQPIVDRAGVAPRGGFVVLALYFFVYVAAEFGIGQWSYSVLTEGRGAPTAWSGVAVAGFWAGLTAGRFALGALGERVTAIALLRGSVTVMTVGLAWFIADPVGTGGGEILPAIGLGFAGVFPVLMSLNPEWLGTAGTSSAVGYQLAASSAGAIVSPLVLGVIADRGGLDSVPLGFGLFGLLVLAAQGAVEVIRLNPHHIDAE